MAAGDGLISMKPTSIAHAGTSASINADGGVDFSAVTSLSLNGVFTSDYDNYLIVSDLKGSGFNGCTLRLRASGSDATGSDYTRQYLYAQSTSYGGARVTDSVAWVAYLSTTQDGFQVHMYGPYLAQPTAMRSVTVNANSGARIDDYACTHSLSTSYDGFTLIMDSGANMTGTVHVFGYEE